MSLDPRKAASDALRKLASELEKGNQNAFKLARRIFSSLITLSNDEDVVLTQALVGSVSLQFYESQSKVEGSKEFLKELGKTVTDLATAIDANDKAGVDSCIRRFMVAIRNRWLVSIGGSSD